MTSDLRQRHQSTQQYVQALASAFHDHQQLYEPSVWLARDPEIEDKMLRDADIAEAVSYRCALIAGRQWTLQPKSKGSPRAALSIDVGTQLLGELKRFSEARKLLARAFLHGQRFARIHGVVKPMEIGDGRTRNWWVPVRLEDVDKRWYRPIVDMKGGDVSAHYERWNLGKRAWEVETLEDSVFTIRHTYQDEQGALGFGRGLRDALGWLWYAKANVWEESLRAAERFGGGTLHAKVSGLRDASTNLPNEEVQRAYIRKLTDMRGRHAIVTDREDEIEVIHGSGEGWQMLSDLREALRTMVKTLVLSANLTTSADKGGSYALGEIQENSTEALVQFDRESLEETLTDTLLRCCWYKNHANLAELDLVRHQPKFNIKQEKRIDPEKRAAVAKTAHEMGLPLAKEDVYEQLGFRKPQDDEEVLEGGAPMGLDGQPGVPRDPFDMFGLNRMRQEQQRAANPPPVPPQGEAKPEGDEQKAKAS